MQALVFNAVNQPVSLREMPLPGADGGKVLVQLRAAALNHRDVYITQGLYPGLRAGVILGSDGAGLVGGRAVILNPNVGWGNNPRFPNADYAILGMPSHGTFAEAIAVSPDRLADVPPHLDFEQAAALPLAGLTAYRTLFTKCQLQTGERVLITGIGGGVALTACQFAIAAGAEVYVTSSSAEKIEAAVKLGAKGGANYRQEGWSKTLGKQVGGFDVIIDSAGGPGFAELVKVAAPGGRIGVYGGTRGKWEGVSPQVIFWKQLSIHGTSMGTDEEFQAMVKFVAQHEIMPVIDAVFPLEKGPAAFARMAAGEQFGKIVLKV